MPSRSVAIAHGGVENQLGGAERLTVELARGLDAPIYATRLDEGLTPDDVHAEELWSGRWDDFFSEGHWWMPRYGYWMLRHLYRRQRATHIPELHEYDVVIQTKGVVGPYVPTDDQTLIRYVHSPPRRHYDHFHAVGDSTASRLWSLTNRVLAEPPRHYPDLWVANSDLVARRLQQYVGVDEEDLRVVYPPVDTASQSPNAAPTGDYYLSLGRLAKNKRTTAIVEAATDLGVPLKVAGDGPRRGEVEAAAGPTVDVLGRVSEAEKRELLSGAKAFIFNARNEDFGMAPIEAMAAGTPVIGVRDGFTQYQVLDGRNGMLYDGGELADAIRRFERSGVEWSAQDHSTWAREHFSVEQFCAGMRAAVDEAVERQAITPAFERERVRQAPPGPPADYPEVRADGGDSA